MERSAYSASFQNVYTHTESCNMRTNSGSNTSSFIPLTEETRLSQMLKTVWLRPFFLQCAGLSGAWKVLSWVWKSQNYRDPCLWSMSGNVQSPRLVDLERTRWGLGFRDHRGLLQTTCGKALVANVAWSIYVLSKDLTTVHQDTRSRYATFIRDLSNHFHKTPSSRPASLHHPFSCLSPHRTLMLLLVQLFIVQ